MAATTTFLSGCINRVSSIDAQFNAAANGAVTRGPFSSVATIVASSLIGLIDIPCLNIFTSSFDLRSAVHAAKILDYGGEALLRLNFGPGEVNACVYYYIAAIDRSAFDARPLELYFVLIPSTILDLLYFIGLCVAHSVPRISTFSSLNTRSTGISILQKDFHFFLGTYARLYI